jgi:hypothetical protein
MRENGDGWKRQTEEGLNSWKNSQEVLITAIYCAHTQKHFNLQLTMIFFLREQVELVGYNFLQKRDKKEKSVKLEKECQRKLENMGICLLVSSVTAKLE